MATSLPCWWTLDNEPVNFSVRNKLNISVFSFNIYQSGCGYLDRYSFEGGEDHFSTLVKSLSVTSHLQRSLVDTTEIRTSVNMKTKPLPVPLPVCFSYQRRHREADHLDAAVVVALRLEVAMVAGVSPRHGARTVPAHSYMMYPHLISSLEFLQSGGK